MGRALQAFCVVLLLAAGPARAQELYAGLRADAQGQSFSYLGGSVELEAPGGLRPLLKAMVSHQRYEYLGTGRRIQARAQALKLLAGLKGTPREGYYAVSAGVEFRSTSLSPPEPGAEVQGGQTGLVLELQGGTALGPYWADAMASYQSLGQGFWAMASLKRRVGQLLALGLAVELGASAEYALFRTGGLAELSIAPGASLGLQAGWGFNQDVPDAPYMGLSLYRRF